MKGYFKIAKCKHKVEKEKNLNKIKNQEILIHALEEEIKRNEEVIKQKQKMLTINEIKNQVLTNMYLEERIKYEKMADIQI